MNFKPPSQPDSDTQKTEPVRLPHTQTPAKPMPGVEAASPVTRTTPKQRRRKRRSRTSHDSGLYLPIWSIVAMLAFVMIASCGIVMFVVSLGGVGNDSTSIGRPVVRIVTAVPLNPTTNPELVFPTYNPPTIQSVQAQQATPESFVMDGPTLEPVAISPTPVDITIGQNVVVIDVGAQGLNIRDSAGTIGTTIIFVAPTSEQFSIVSGPIQADGYTWWEVQNANDPALRGWAAGQFLQVEP